MGLTTEYPWLAKPLDTLNRLKAKQSGSILISGCRGAGLFELAEAFAESLLCKNPVNGEACGKCSECTLNKAGSHPDLKLVLSEAEQAIHPEPWAEPVKATAKKSLTRNIVIEQIRDITDYLSTGSIRGGKKVVVVYPANMMQETQSSALLKTLEEPPPDSVLILVTENLEALLPTIRSRCQIINVPSPSAEQGIAYLKGKGIANPEETLARLGGLPLLYFEEDDKLLLGEDLENTLLNFLSKGAMASSADVVAITNSILPTLPLAIFLQRWVNDLVLAANKLPPRYFLRAKGASARIGKSVDVKKLMNYLDEIRRVKQTTFIALNPTLIAQDLLFHYIQACKT
ncbi:MAG: DNA polymerase III subunit delta' [Burkholderiales bacterium]|nr:DNA polymerase III subunit delta' [Burkholderiales bacterium]